MSQAGRGQPNEPHLDDNGNLIWDADNPPTIFACSNWIKHHPKCNHHCDTITLNSELAVALLNEAKAYAEMGASFLGVPISVRSILPITGIDYDGFDMMCYLEALKEIVIDRFGIDEFEIDERYRAKKLSIMRDARENAERIRAENEVKERLGITDKPILGPNGKPFH